MFCFFVAPWTVTCQAPLYVGFPRQDWSGLLFPFTGDLLNPGIEPASPALADGFFITKPPSEPLKILLNTAKLNSSNSLLFYPTTLKCMSIYFPTPSLTLN